MADSFEDLLHLDHETMVVDRFGQFDDTKVTRTLIDTFFTLFAFVRSINRAEMRIVWALSTSSNTLLIPNEWSDKEEMTRFLPRIYILRLRIHNVDDR